MIDDKLSANIHVPLTPTQRRQIDDLARAEALKPATKARQLILAGLAAQKSQSPQIEVRNA